MFYLKNFILLSVFYAKFLTNYRQASEAYNYLAWIPQEIIAFKVFPNLF